jgi:CRISPR system Cascade subunit CasB
MPMSEAESELARRAVAIAAALAAASPGEKAEARRMGPAGAPVFWRQVARLGISMRQEANWLRFTRLIALMTPASRETSIHDASQKLGAVLYRAKFSEDRLARLMASRGAARDTALERAIRMIARETSGLNVTDLAKAVFYPEQSNFLARAYYQEFDQSQTEDTQND